MTGPSGDKDDDADYFPIPTCPGHRGHYGGGKSPPTTVHQVRHSGTQKGTEQQAPCHISVHQGSGAKDASASGGGSEGEIGGGLGGIRGAAGKCDGV